MCEVLLDNLGERFVKHRVRERYGITFEQFLELYDIFELK